MAHETAAAPWSAPHHQPPGAQAAAHYRRPLLHSPFFEASRPWIQTDSFIAWAGYLTPDVYSYVEHEYFAIRNSCALFDLTPMVKYRISGLDAERYLNRLVTGNMAKLAPNRVLYTLWCDDLGHVIDDGTVFRLGPQEFRVCCQDRQLDWFLDCAFGFDVQVTEATADIAALALQGPTAFAVLEAAGFSGLDTLSAMGIAQQTVKGMPVMVSRTGFTGDLGYELWVAPEHAAQLWDTLMQTGASRGITPMGYQALEMARIEAGFILPGADFMSCTQTLRLGRESTPWELNLDWTVALDKGHFNGRRALLEARARGVRRKLVGLELDGNKPGHGALVYADAENNIQIGEISSALWSPTLKRNIAIARIDAPYCDSQATFWVDLYLHRELHWERRNVRSWIVPRPFYAPARRRALPPPLR